MINELDEFTAQAECFIQSNGPLKGISIDQLNQIKNAVLDE